MPQLHIFQVKAQLLKEQEQVKKLTNDLTALKQASTNQKSDGSKEVDASKKALATTQEKLTQLQDNMAKQLKDLQAQLDKANASKTESETSVGQLKGQLEAAQKAGGKSEEQDKVGFITYHLKKPYTVLN